MRESEYRRKLQRVPNGIIFCVAEGIARYLRIPVWVVRALWILAAITTGLLPVAVVYLLLALILPVGPA